MRKRIIPPSKQIPTSQDTDWLNLMALAEVELTSEDAGHPIESALLPGITSGWRASEPGQQTIRLLFAFPQRLRRIGLSFVDTHTTRTQEYVLRWSQDFGQSYQEVVRQQWNFSPEGETRETEDLRVNLPEVSALELIIIPDISGGDAFASLQQWRLA